MFTADLLKEITIPCEVSFVKMASYQGTQSTGKVNELIGLDEDIENRNVILIEDIVDTGNTLLKLVDSLKNKNIKSLKICTLLFKPEPYHNKLKLDYVGLEIPNKFVVGYGLDYDNLGRNLKEIYVLSDN
jgi:hypoxanthine phosphoribosyltransferase